MSLLSSSGADGIKDACTELWAGFKLFRLTTDFGMISNPNFLEFLDPVIDILILLSI